MKLDFCIEMKDVKHTLQLRHNFVNVVRRGVLLCNVHVTEPTIVVEARVNVRPNAQA